MNSILPLVYRELDVHFAGMVQAETMDVYCKWEIGKVLLKWYPEKMTAADVKKIANHYGRRDQKELYTWRTFYEKYPERDLLDRAIHDRLNGKASWRGVKAILLPKTVPSASEQVLGRYEASTVALGELVEKVKPEDVDQVVASITTGISESFSALKTLDADASVVVDRPTDFSDLDEFASFDAPFTDGVRKASEQMQRVNGWCYACGPDVVHDEVHVAHWPMVRTRSDRTILLCHKHHMSFEGSQHQTADQQKWKTDNIDMILESLQLMSLRLARETMRALGFGR